VEEIVSREEIRKAPDLTILPGFRVTAVCHAPLGAYPSYVEGHYGRDDSFYLHYDHLGRDPEALRAFVTAAIEDHPDWEAFVRSRGDECIARILQLADPRAGAGAGKGERR
jgi:glutaconate CoA-transferase subunit A